MPLLNFNGPVHEHYLLSEDRLESTLWKKILSGKPTQHMLDMYALAVMRLMNNLGYTPVSFKPNSNHTFIYFEFTTRLGRIYVYEYEGKRHMCYPDLVDPDLISIHS